MVQIKGLPGAPGCVAGTVVTFTVRPLSLERKNVENAQAEIAVLEAARKRYENTLSELAAGGTGERASEQAAIFEAYREILQDDVFFGEVRDLVASEHVCASYAIEKKRADTEAMFAGVDDVYLKGRADDINNVCRELMAELQGITTGNPLAGVKGNQLVIFAEDLTPADTVRLDRSRLAGIVTERGGITAHTVILAKALGIPAVVGTGAMLEKVRTGDSVLVDGAVGTAMVGADEETIQVFLRKKEKADHQKTLFDSRRTAPARSKDGVDLCVNINSGDSVSIRAFDVNSCDGVGLFRTEFLYMGQTDYPSEDIQFDIYRDMAIRTQGKELIIRTLDIGGDKQLDYMDLPKEANPFLGYRAIRLCLDRTTIFLTQLRAILRASVFGDVKIMFPMIVNLEELLQAKELLEEAKAQLDGRGIPYNRNVAVGIMVETPAAVLLSDQLARHCDFFSIGSNDLIQYTTATDRQNERVQNLYDCCNISFLRAVHMTCENAHKAGIPIGICGETASEPRLIPIWTAMGIDELSVAPGLVGRTKYIFSQLSQTELQPVLRQALECSRIENVKALLDGVLREIGL